MIAKTINQQPVAFRGQAVTKEHILARNISHLWSLHLDRLVQYWKDTRFLTKVIGPRRTSLELWRYPLQGTLEKQLPTQAESREGTGDAVANSPRI